MTGVIQDEQADPAETGEPTGEPSELLKQLEDKIESTVPPEDKAAYTKIVVAGMKVMFDKSTHDLALQAMEGPDKATAAGQGIATLMAMLFKESRNTMPLKPAMFAAITLLCDALDYLEKAGELTADAETIDRAVKMMVEAIFKNFGLKPEDVDKMLGQLKSVSEDPAKMKQLQAHAAGSEAAPEDAAQVPPPSDMAKPAPGPQDMIGMQQANAGGI